MVRLPGKWLVPTPTEEQKGELQRWLESPDSGTKLRARIVLETAAGKSDSAVARELGTTRPTVAKWRNRFVRAGIEGLMDLPRSGAPRRIGDTAVERVIERTVDGLPPERHRWTVRSMAAASGLPHAAVQRIWERYGLNPSRYRTYSITRDRAVFAQIRAVIGVYLHPPCRALVLAGERSSRPGLVRRTADTMKERSWLALLDDACRKRVASMSPWRRVVIFRRFLENVMEKTAAGEEIHLVMYGFAVHEGLLLEAGERCHVHFAPTCAAWIDQVMWYCVTTSGAESLAPAIEAYVGADKQVPEPFSWTSV